MSLIYLSKRGAILSLLVSAPAWAGDLTTPSLTTRADARTAVAQTKEQKMRERDSRSESRFWAWWREVMGKKPVLSTVPEFTFTQLHNPMFDPGSLKGADTAGK